MQLQLIDWVIVVATILICFVPALFFGKRAGKSTSEFFVSGRSVPWWLAGLSMVATTFSSDTPNLVTDFVRNQGVAGNWQWWALVLTGVSTVFFYAQLWRRSGAMTDLEFYELRYSGRAASFVRGFRAIYLGLFFNCIIIASVNLAACKIANVLFGLPMWQTLIAVGLLNVIFAAHSGLWGVLIIDMLQFTIMMTSAIAAAYFAVKHVGGLHVIVEQLSAPRPSPDGKSMINYLNFLPDFQNNWDLALAVFIMPIGLLWWSVWYPGGGEPGGGTFIAQRMLASKTEKDSLGAVLFFNIAHYVLRPWPWILVGLSSLLVFPELSDIRRAFPGVDPQLVGHDMAYPAMLKFLPAGFIGLMVGGLIAANSSTMLSLLNWGASYLVHDFYQRFIRPPRTSREAAAGRLAAATIPDAPAVTPASLTSSADEKHYVLAGRLATVGLFLVSCTMVPLLSSAKESFELIFQVGAGTGLLYLLRWFWWRVNAWCEVNAMISSFSLTVLLFTFKKTHLLEGTDWEFLLQTHWALVITIAITTVCWVLTAYLARPTDRQTLIAFYLKVRPFGPGWLPIRREVGVSEREAEATHQNIPLALLGCASGSIVIWSSLFTVGSYLYGRYFAAGILLAIFVLSGLTLVYVFNRLFSPSAKPSPAPDFVDAAAR